MVKLFINMISNKEIKNLASLSTKKGRKQEGKYLIEGFRIIRSALRNNTQVIKIYISDKLETSADFRKILPTIPDNIDVEVLNEKTITKICQTVNPAGIVATCLLIDDNKIKSLIDNWIFLDRISDPGNIGTLLRSALWFGVNNIYCQCCCTSL